MPEATLFRRGLRLVVRLVRLHPAPFAVSVTGAAVFAAGTVASTIVLGRATDRVVLPTFDTGRIPAGSLWWTVGAVLAVALIRAAGVVGRRYFAAVTGERVQVSLRYRLADHYLGLPQAWHQRTPAGQLLAHVDNDTEITAEVLSPLPFSLGAGFLAVMGAVSILVVDPLLAAVAFAIFPAMAVVNRVYSHLVEGPAAAVQAAVGTVSSIAHESFDGALVVKTLGRAGAEGERFAAATRRLQEHRRSVGHIRAAFESVLDALPNLGIVSVVVVGAVRIESGAMTVGDLVQVASLFTVLAVPMRVFGYFLESIPPSVVASRRIDRVLDEPLLPTPEGRTPGGGPEGCEGRRGLSVTVRGLTYAYPDDPVLAGVDLDLAPGEVVALVGSTGAGKSTLCHLLAGLVAPDHGRIDVGPDRSSAVALDTLDPGWRTDAIALVFQEAFLFADTIEANITLGLPVAAADLSAALATAQLDRFLGDLPDGMATVVGERGVTLSGGQRQRVALARALVRRPRLLLLDDATSAVDAVVEHEILTRLRSGLGATTLLVAQRISTIELADRVLYLDGRRIAAAGTHHELLADPGYAAIVRAYDDLPASGGGGREPEGSRP
ncbi:MAG: ABC transporter ATP-binding protein [Acidimicrobiales bacterium]